LDHSTGTHVDSVGRDTTVEFAWIGCEGLALLEGVFAIVEGLEAKDFDDAYGHADSGVL
jgi:hypothetical protein